MKHKKLLVISNLVLLFNLLAPAFGANTGQNSSLNIKNDQAIFRLGGQVYFLSDLKESQRSLGILSCSSSEVLLDKYLGKSWKDLGAIKLNSVLSNKDAVAILDPFVALERLKNSVLSRGKDSLNKNELLGLGKKCGAKGWESLKINDKAILLIEVYLRDRFGQSENLLASLGELKKGLRLKDKHEFLSLSVSRSLMKARQKALVHEEKSEEPSNGVPSEKVNGDDIGSGSKDPSLEP